MFQDNPQAHPTTALPTRSGAGLTERLLDLCDRPVTPTDRTRAALHLRDWLGCAIAAQGMPAQRGLASLAEGRGRAEAFGAGRRGAEVAAFVNGGPGLMLEMDDLHRATVLHVGNAVIPAALAVAQDTAASPKRLLNAIVTGYEVAIRIGSAVAGYSALYNSAVCGVFGAAEAAANVLNLDTAARTDALGLAGMQAAGLWQCRLDPSDGKALASAHAARAGVTAARLAAAGLRGPRRILEGDLGLFAAFYQNARPDRVTAEPHAPWHLHAVSFKPWPACRHTHPAIAAALTLAPRCDSGIVSVEVATYAAAIDFCATVHPASDHAARFSLPHMVAVALRGGAPTLKDVGDRARNDPQIAALRDRIILIEVPTLTAAFPDRMGATVTIRQESGPTLCHTAEHAPGDPEAPLSATDLRNKFRVNARHGGLPESDIAALDRAQDDLPRASATDDLNAALLAANATLTPDEAS